MYLIPILHLKVSILSFFLIVILSLYNRTEFRLQAIATSPLLQPTNSHHQRRNCY